MKVAVGAVVVAAGCAVGVLLTPAALASWLLIGGLAALAVGVIALRGER